MNRFENIRQDELVELYTNPADGGRFVCGRIIAQDGDFLIAELLSPYGDYDGLLLKTVDSIFKAATGTRYLDKMAFLGRETLAQERDYRLQSGNPAAALLDYALRRKKVVSLELDVEDAGVSGFVEVLNDGLCTLRQIGEYGEDDGAVRVAVADIIAISCDSQDERVLERLYRRRTTAS